MTNTLTNSPTAAVLDRLFSAAEAQEVAEAAAGPDPEPPAPTRAPTDPARESTEPVTPAPEPSAQERADAQQDVYMTVSRDGGRLLYALTRATRPQTVVEFGTSFGISAIHLAAAV